MIFFLHRIGMVPCVLMMHSMLFHAHCQKRHNGIRTHYLYNRRNTVDRFERKTSGRLYKLLLLSIESNSIRLGRPAHGIVTKTVHKTLPGGGMG